MLQNNTDKRAFLFIFFSPLGQNVLRDIDAGQECADRIGKSTREVADTVRSLVEGANTLRLAERNEQGKVKAKLKAHQEQQSQEFTGYTTNTAM
jgi:hypothetical protein